jgi:hypothetical protein
MYAEIKGHTIAQAFICWLLTVEAPVHVHISSVGFVVDKVALGQVFL